jgi:predicted regulator of Ras-like GTPase activity (Roadblock/LC7/MglB family)
MNSNVITNNKSTSNLIYSIQDELENLFSFETINAVLLFRIDGILLESCIDISKNFELLSTLDWIKTIISKVGSDLKSNLYRIAYSRSNEHVYFYKVGSAAILACVLNKFANLGLLAIEMDRIAFKIADISSISLL